MKPSSDIDALTMTFAMVVSPLIFSSGTSLRPRLTGHVFVGGVA
jgi:hypothetical protein